MANYTSTHTGATIDASVTIVSSSGVTQSDLTKLNAVTSSAVELNLLDGVTASTAEINILDGLTATTAELNYLDGADSSITTLSLPDNTTITTFGASLIDDADAASARTTLGVDVAGTDNSTDVTLVTTSHDYLSISGQAITLGSIDISDDTNLVGGTGITLTGDTLSTTDSEIVHDNLSGFVANEHIDHSTVSISAGTGLSGGGDLTSTRTLSIDSSVVTLSGIQTLANKSISGTANTISNVHIVDDTINTLTIARGGTGGTTASEARSNLNVDVAGTDNSTDVTLVTTSHDYLSLTGQAITLGTIDIGDDTNLVGGTGITLTGDTLSTTDSEIVHDNLSGFVANEHIDHSGVSITAGAGLTGGGDITATRDIAVGAGTGVTVNADDIAIGQDVGTTQDVTFNSVTADIIGDIRGATKFQAKADVALNKGDAVYISGISGNTPTVDIADANDSAKMPSFGLAASSVSINASVEIITFGTLSGLNTSAFSVGDIIYISTNGTSGNTLTATAPSGESSLIQNIGKVQRSHASAGSIKVGGAGRSNATPNLDDGNIFIGNGSNQAVTASLNTKIEDYLDGGTSTANFDTISVDGAEITATPAELNVLDGITSTTAELNYTDGVTSNIQTQLDAKAPLASPAFTGTATGANLTLSGDLTVNGSTTTLDTTNLAVEDNLMELNAGVTSNANDSGFLIERGSTGDNAIFMWDESADKFTLGTTTATGTTTGDITLSSTGTLVANVEGDVTGAVTGNADTATTLATARNFSLTGDVTAGAVSFDGSGNVALSTTIAANSVALGTDTTGNYMSDLTEGTGIDITHTPAEGSNATITLDLTEVGFGGGANRLITDDGDGTVSTEANLTFDGTNLYLPDSSNIKFGDSQDLEIKHDGSNSIIKADGTGNLTIRQDTADADILLRCDDGAGGITDYIRLDGSTVRTDFDKPIEVNDNAFFADSSVAYFGAGNDLRLFHDSSNSYVYGYGTGNLQIGHTIADADTILVGDNGSGGTTAYITLDGSATRVVVGDVDLSIPVAKRLYFGGGDHTYISEDIDDRLRFFTGGSEFMRFTESGSDTINLYHDTYFTDRALFNSGNFSVQHDSNHAYISNNNGNMYIRQQTNDADLVLMCDNGSGGDTAYITLDGSSTNLLLSPPGNVGIGTTSPGYKLDVAGQGKVTNGWLVDNGTTAGFFTTDSDNVNFGASTSGKGLKLYSANSEAMRIDSSGRLLIGDTSVHYSGTDLQVGNTSDSQNGIQIQTSTTGNGYVLFGDGTGASAYRGQLRYDHTNDSLNLSAGGTESVFLKSANLGIGTSTPDEVLHIFGSSPKIKIENSAESSGGILFVDQQDESQNAKIFFDASARSLDFHTDGAEAMTITGTSDGRKVGIGTTSPSTITEIKSTIPVLTLTDDQNKSWTSSDGTLGKLSFKTSDTSGIGVHEIGFISLDCNLSSSTTPNGELVFGTAGVNAAATEKMRIDEDGNVGIGTSSPSKKLEVAGDVRIASGGDLILSDSGGGNDTFLYNDSQTFITYVNGAERLRIDSQGNLKFADNGTNPSAAANTAFLFNDGGEMKVLDELGNTTTISPHNFSLIPDGASEERAWGYYSEKDIVDDEGNVTATQKVNVDMMKLARLVEQLTGEKLVYTEED